MPATIMHLLSVFHLTLIPLVIAWFLVTPQLLTRG
jgi:hypothetical protein